MSDAAKVARVRIGEAVPLEWTGLSWYVVTTVKGKAARARDWLEGFEVPTFMLEGKQSVARRGSSGGARRVETHNVLPGYLFVGDLHKTLSVVNGMAIEARAQTGLRLVHDAALKDGRLDAARLDRALSRVGRAQPCPVTGLVHVAGVPHRVNGAVMQALFTAHETAIHVPKSDRDAHQARIRPGDSVVVTEGPLQFVEGIVHSYRNGNHVEIMANLFSGQVPVSVRFDFLDRIDP